MKKLTSLILATILVCGLMATPGFAAPKGKITGWNNSYDMTDEYDSIEVKPGTVIEIPLTADMFEWDGTNEIKDLEKSAVTSSHISSGKVVLKSSQDSNSKKIVEKIELVYTTQSGLDKKTATIRVEFVDVWTKTDELEFTMSVYLNIKSKKQTNSTVTISGTFGNEIYTIDEDEGDYDLSGGDVIEPETYIRDIELHLGDGLYMNTKLYQNKQYYGVAEVGVKEEDYKVLDAYPEITTVYTVKTVNLNDKVWFDFDEDDVHYVYGADGTYLGTTNEKIKFSNKYYLADEKIKTASTSSSSSKSSSKKDEPDDDDDWDGDDVVYVVEDDDPEEEWYDGYDYLDNPKTGVKGMIGMVSMLAAVSVAIVAMTGRKNNL